MVGRFVHFYVKCLIFPLVTVGISAKVIQQLIAYFTNGMGASDHNILNLLNDTAHVDNLRGHV